MSRPPRPAAPEPIAATLLRAMVHAVSAGVFAWPLSNVGGVVAASLGAATGALLGPLLARGPLRSPTLAGLGALGIGLALFTRWAATGTDWVAPSLGPAGALELGDALFFFLAPFALLVALRGLSARHRPLQAVEVVAIGAAFAQLVVAHRGGAINRPFELTDSILAAGGDPTDAFLAIGGVGTAMIVLFLLSERYPLRALLHLLVVAVLLLLVGTETSVLEPPPPPPGGMGLGLRPEEQPGRPEEEGGGQGRGQAGEEHDEDLEFRDELDQASQRVPVAVVLFHTDYSPVTGVYYLRQGAFSQYNGRRLVAAATTSDSADGGADQDGDGLSGDEERALGSDPRDRDSDDDGVADGDEADPGADVDDDGLPNVLDPDSDNDGLLDGTELGREAPGPDTNVLMGNFAPDADPSTTTDPQATDSDGDGIADGAADFDRDGRAELEAGAPPPLDTDGDGLSDETERSLGSDPADADTDEDGVLDGQEPNAYLDSDRDGRPNLLDPDSDDDGLYDGTEVGVREAPADTDLSVRAFVPGAGRTSALRVDSDGGGEADGAEDANQNGVRDPDETDPTDPSDDRRDDRGGENAGNVRVDADIASAFPYRDITIEAAPRPAGPRTEVETTVALLADHNRPFGLEAPYQLHPAGNPNPERFRRVYRVTSASMATPFRQMLGARAGDADWGDAEWAHYTRAPDDPRYLELAMRILEEKLPEHLRAAPVARMLAITEWLGEQGTYSLQSRHASASDPTAHFLFGDLKGYCVHFAHAATYLMRSVGLPARVATGYAIDEAARQGGSALLVTGDASHAWPEVRIEGYGWVVADVSPQTVLSPPPAPPDADLQRLLGELVRGLENVPPEEEPAIPAEVLSGKLILRAIALTLMGLLALLALLLTAAKVWRGVAPGFAPERARPRVVYRAALDRLSELALRRERGESREAFARRVEGVVPSFGSLTDVHVGVAFGSERARARSKSLAQDTAKLQAELAAAYPWWRRLLGRLTPWSWLSSR